MMTVSHPIFTPRPIRTDSATTRWTLRLIYVPLPMKRWASRKTSILTPDSKLQLSTSIRPPRLITFGRAPPGRARISPSDWKWRRSQKPRKNAETGAPSRRRSTNLARLLRIGRVRENSNVSAYPLGLLPLSSSGATPTAYYKNWSRLLISDIASMPLACAWRDCAGRRSSRGHRSGRAHLTGNSLHRTVRPTSGNS